MFNVSVLDQQSDELINRFNRLEVRNAGAPPLSQTSRGGAIMLDVSDIDLQHKELIAKFNLLNEAVRLRAPRDKIYLQIDEIISYTRLHFAAEEEVMKASGYPMLEAHQAKHRELIQDSLRLKGKLNHIGEEMFTDWLEHWPFSRVLAHIQYADRQLEDHIFNGGGKV
ncbi:MAG TPA: hemerythrin family protein [Gallionellaceae bacterium]